MDKRDYDKLCEWIVPSEQLIKRTEREADQVLSRKKYRRVARRSVAIAVLAILVTVGVALAATYQSGILDALFRREAPSQAARDALRTDSASVSSDGLTLNVDEFLMDGNSLTCKWTVTSSRDEDVYYLTYYALDDGGAAESQSAMGAYGGSSSLDCGDMTLVRLTPEQNSYSGDLRMAYATLPEQSPIMKLTVYAYLTDLTPTEIENASDVIHASAGDSLIRDLEARGAIAFDGRQLSSIWAYGPVQDAYMALIRDGADGEAAETQAMARSGFVRELTTLTLSIALNPASAAAQAGPYFTLDEARTVRLPGRTVVLNHLNLDIASTTIQYDIYPDELPKARNLLAGYRYLLFDPQGNPLDVDYSLNLGIDTNMTYDEAAGIWTLSEGEETARISVSVDGLPLPETLASIRFVPTCELERNEGEPSDAYYRRMAALADKEDAFVIKLKR